MMHILPKMPFLWSSKVAVQNPVMLLGGGRFVPKAFRTLCGRFLTQGLAVS